MLQRPWPADEMDARARILAEAKAVLRRLGDTEEFSRAASMAHLAMEDARYGRLDTAESYLARAVELAGETA